MNHTKSEIMLRLTVIIHEPQTVHSPQSSKKITKNIINCTKVTFGVVLKFTVFRTQFLIHNSKTTSRFSMADIVIILCRI